MQYVRDVALGKDEHQMSTGHAPRVLAALRNTALNLVRAAGWTNSAAALLLYLFGYLTNGASSIRVTIAVFVFQTLV